MNKKIKIGIVGAGPAGSFTALLLSRQGHDVVVLEKKSTITRKLCGEYLCPKGVDLLDSYQLKEKFCEKFLLLNGMILASPDEIVISCDFPQTNKSWSGISLNRELFDQRIIDEAIKNGVTVNLNTTVNSIYKQNKKWIIATNEEQVEVDLLIAADGRRSNIAKILGHSAKIDTSRIAIHFYLPRNSFQGLRYGEMHIFNDGAYCGLDPINDNEVNVSFIVDSNKLKGSNSLDICNDYLKSSKRLMKMFGEIPEGVDLKVVTPLINKNLFVAGDGLAYVGDASGFIDPLTGEGIYNALLSGHLLSETIKQEATLKDALKVYRKTKKRVQFQKKVLNQIFQNVIKKPLLCHCIALFISKKAARANYFIGIIGNIYSPVFGLFKMLLA
ncbi:MAG: NAD(P)/FAD-dependent oxidoreductase [Bacteriovorax sp.]|nr:NAD(P)/FAD-dependent oxidoreductase [Bacteriovorax sp.]